MSALIDALLTRRYALALWVLCVALLALSSAALAALVGPLLRVVFGGEQLEWSPLLSDMLGSPPSVSSLRSALPWLIGATASLKAVSFYGERVTRASITRHVGYQLRASLLGWALQLSEDERRALGQGEVRERLTVDVERVERWVELGGAGGLRDGAQVIALACSALVLSGWAGLVVLTVYPLLIAPIIWVGRKLKRAARQEISSARHLGRWSAYAEAHLGYMSAHSRDNSLSAELDERHESLERAQSRLAHLQGLAPSFTELSVSWVIAGSLGGFVWGLDAGWWSAEQLMSLFVCVVMLYAPVKSLGRAHQLWAVGRVALERVTELPQLSSPRDDHLARQRATRLVTEEVPLGANQESLLELCEVQPLRGGEQLAEQRDHQRDHQRDGLSIEQRGWMISSPLSLSLTQGERVAILGENGAGKSSLLLALAGLVPVSGSIRSDVDSLRWSPQPPLIFADELSHFVKILMSHPFNDPSGHISQESELARRFKLDLARLSELIESTPDMMRSVAYWDWTRGLSSGELQRLALCLHFAELHRSCREADHLTHLLLLDEPEAHLDRVGLDALIESLDTLPERVITIIATHSLVVSDACDHVITLNSSGEQVSDQSEQSEQSE